MDIFSRERFMKGALVVLLLVNILALGTLWYTRINRQPGLPGPAEGKPSMLKREFVDRMARELKLDMQQKEKFAALQDRFYDEASRLVDDNGALRRELTGEISKPKLDREKASELAARIGKNQEQLEMTRYSHFYEMRQLLTPEQDTKFPSITRDIVRRPPAHHPPPHHGAPPPPPGHGEQAPAGAPD